MTEHRTRILQLALAALVGALITGGGYALAGSTTSSQTIHACVAKRTRQLRIAKRCGRNETSLTWDREGPAGPPGPKGDTGATGPQGIQGLPGQNAVGTWEVVDANGNRVSGSNFTITHVAPGSYELAGATGARNCAIQVTPENNSTGVIVPPIIASAANGPGLQVIYLTDTNGHGVDDGFSVSVQC